MPVTIVATPGAADANSFVTVAAADAYLATRLNATEWTGDDAKAIALIEATREISPLAYLGYRVTETQALGWPRYGAPNPDGIGNGAWYDQTVIPPRVQDAICELALEFLRAGTSDISKPDATAQISKEIVGPIETDYVAVSDRAMGLARYPRISRLLAPLLLATPGQVRLVR